MAAGFGENSSALLRAQDTQIFPAHVLQSSKHPFCPQEKNERLSASLGTTRKRNRSSRRESHPGLSTHESVYRSTRTLATSSVKFTAVGKLVAVMGRESGKWTRKLVVELTSRYFSVPTQGSPNSEFVACRTQFCCLDMCS